ncbi:hypothetical protein EV189_3822 [Motilibacter rhizosphaerae]|uniref:Intracellular proteinase inhibitor BsuPI n=2 Tax=Motilibacter rhizosphaerae TaxID=598652 RepID=A0A4Q7NAJ4_9ACTN|nr:hypothetical protein EV189_3822 [Motilibacter rhizosphaerae]
MQPVGPEPPTVYWRRRALVLGGLVVVLALLLAYCTRGGGGSGGSASSSASSSSAASDGASDGASVDAVGGGLEPSAPADDASSAASGEPAASGASTAEASASATPAAGGTCADSAITVSVRTDARAYAVGGRPHISLSVTNSSRAACRRDVGSAALSVVVRSGADRVWSSDDCGGKGTSRVTPLAAGAAYSTSVTWSGKRSAPGECGARPAAKAGTYTVTAYAGRAASTPVRFVLR